MTEKIFLLGATLVLVPRWVLGIDSPWLLLLEVPVLAVLVVLLVRNITRWRGVADG
ncbi:MAG: hypothetical protein V2A58_11360 [Planctomycetota bacterium]